jgi:hypothetical protein
MVAEIMGVNDPMPEVTVSAPAPSSSSAAVMTGTLVAVGTLTADDVTGIGIADDHPAIPAVLVGGAVVAGAIWLNDVFTEPYPQYRHYDPASNSSKNEKLCDGLYRLDFRHRRLYRCRRQNGFLQP